MRAATRARRAAPVLITAALSGCLLGPDYVRPKVDVPPSFRFEYQDVADVANAAWWEQFQDPVLNELIATALAENRDVKIASWACS
jgi:outer membrane protein, multidrug efflux system